LTAALPDRQGRAERARELYESGMSLRQVGAVMGVAHTTVRFLLAAGEAPEHPRHLQAVPASARAPRPTVQRQVVPTRAEPRPMTVEAERAAIAYSADRGWHMVQAPPGWFLELLAELD